MSDTVWARDLKPGDKIIHPLTGKVIEVVEATAIMDVSTDEFVELDNQHLALPMGSLVQRAFPEDDE